MSEKDREIGLRNNRMYVSVRHGQIDGQKSPWMKNKEMILLWLAVWGALGTAFEKAQCMQCWASWQRPRSV